jgi:hypothetical protein
MCHPRRQHFPTLSETKGVNKAMIKKICTSLQSLVAKKKPEPRVLDPEAIDLFSFALEGAKS